jgi:hypothetical protein
LGGYFFVVVGRLVLLLPDLRVDRPGLIRPTWMFEPARSFHRPSVNEFIADFDAA